jgi:hypothetical protein
MELKEFIKEALLNITTGVKEANKADNRFKIIGIKHDKTGMDGNFVDFDVSIVVNETSTGGAGGKIEAKLLNVVSAGVDSKISQTNSSQNMNRLTFKIYISE